MWVGKALLLALHDEVLQLTGGAAGLRDDGLLEAALARPLNRFAYAGVEDVLELAATYVVGVAKNHPFIDGNKRAAFACLGLFLLDNGFAL
jgi:death-on-curing protein